MNILYHSRFRKVDYNKSGVDIFDEDWDNLILLDACRYDAFAETVDLEGRLESRISRGATSPEFMRGNFTNAIHHDTVYVTGNGWYFKLRDDINAELHAERNVQHDGIDPTPITDAALEATAKYPNKRLIIHYMHPHYPYLGKTATEDRGGFNLQTDGLLGDIQRREVSIPDEVIRQAYLETLEAVLDEVARLLDTFQGKTIISADHGELLGERCFPLPIKDYSHHGKLYVEELVKIPWFVHETGERKDIVAESPEAKVETDEEAVDERLRKLGYKL
ncbi:MULTISPECIES: hypothetical protein [Salinibaculum]|uniref:hypothetical protein n=1 Tax=Salinibaculum TaxID=2732368 RepID=UPI0030D3FA3B